MKFSQRVLLVAIATGLVSASVPSAQAGPWIDSLLGRRPPAYPVGGPVPLAGQTAAYMPPSYAPNAGSQLAYPNTGYTSVVPPTNYYGANQYGANQVAGFGNYGVATPPSNNAPLLAPGFPQTVVGALPTAAYDTTWSRTPVTYYRPVTAYDPRYGTTVTSMQPCTSYQYQAQRSPVIAPRAVFGDYGMQANKWPSITGPGYNPTGLVASPVYPVNPYQSVPNGGLQYYGQPNPYAPVASSGGSSGMPSSTLPATTLPANVMPSNAVPYSGLNYNNNYTSTAVGVPTYAAPGTSSYSSSMPAINYSNQAIGTGVVPSAAWTPASALQSPAVPAPYVPGASSVTPVGPPTYSLTPASSASTGFVNPAQANISNPAYNTAPINNFQPYNTPAGNSPFNTAPVLNGNEVMPSNQVLPNTDSESTTVPSLGKPASSGQPQSTRLPMVAIERGSNGLNSMVDSAKPQPALGLLQPKDSIAASPSNPSNTSVNNESSPIPSTLPANNKTATPLFAPEDFDTKAKWNPTLLDPEDRTVMTRRKIRVKEDDTLDVKTVAQSSNRNVIRLVSGTDEATDSSSVTSATFKPIAQPATRTKN